MTKEDRQRITAGLLHKRYVRRYRGLTYAVIDIGKVNIRKYANLVVLTDQYGMKEAVDVGVIEQLIDKGELTVGDTVFSLKEE